MKSFSLLILFFFSIQLSFSQQEATTADGKKVILNPDGSWQAIAADSTTTTHFKNLELPKPWPGDVLITHLAYTVSYKTTYKLANWVAYELTAAETNAIVKRNDNFTPDPLLKSGSASLADYKGSGYDRGHLAPAADMCFSYQAMQESFYLTNIAPQDQSFNRGIWAKLEKQLRQWAIDDKAVYIVTGTLASKGNATIGINKIDVPQSFYKVVLDYTAPEIKGIAFIMANQGSKEDLQHFAVTIDSLEKLTGIDFFYQIPEKQQRVFESVIDPGKWSWSSTSTKESGDKAATSTQCQGKTKAGAQCKNKTLNANGYCYLHQNQTAGSVNQENSVKSPSPKRSVSVRCGATTKKGTQCSRKTLSPNGRCWQHGGD